MQDLRLIGYLTEKAADIGTGKIWTELKKRIGDKPDLFECRLYGAIHKIYYSSDDIEVVVLIKLLAGIYVKLNRPDCAEARYSWAADKFERNPETDILYYDATEINLEGAMYDVYRL